EFSYDNSYHASIKAAPFEAFDGRKFRSPVYWTEVGRAQILGPELIQETIEKLVQIKQRMQATHDRQKSYADLKLKLGRNEVLMVNLVRVEKVKALGANGDMSGSRVGVVWMEVGGGTVRARVVSRVVLRLVGMGSRDFGSCKEWDQECSCSRDHSLPFGGEFEKVNQMTQCQEELELRDEAFFPHA
nr:putative reverse transcriptase domain-containing protein [Tanacetum cinerariifolium]